MYNTGDPNILCTTRMAFGAVCEPTAWVRLEFCEMESQLYPKAQKTNQSRADPSDVAALQGHRMATAQGEAGK